MPDYDLAIRGGTITTASDTFRGDIGVRGGRIVAIADRVEGAAREIDASGLRVLRSGVLRRAPAIGTAVSIALGYGGRANSVRRMG